MAEVVNYSLKLDSEVKNSLLTKISETNMTAGEFVASLLATYEAAQSQESLFDVRELQQMENHLIRVKEIYIGLAKRLRDEQLEHELTREKLGKEVEIVQADRLTAATQAGKEIDAAKGRIAELERELRESKEKESQAQSLAAASTEILEAQKQQIEELKRKTDDFKRLEEDNAKLKSELDALNKTFIEFQQSEVTRLRNELSSPRLEQPSQEIVTSEEVTSENMSE